LGVCFRKGFSFLWVEWCNLFGPDYHGCVA